VIYSVAKLRETIGEVQLLPLNGTIQRVTGLLIESQGPLASVGDLCHIRPRDGGPPVKVEVVGFSGTNLLSMALGGLQGVKAGDLIEVVLSEQQIPVSEAYLGRVVNGLGAPLDGLGPIPATGTFPLRREPPSPLDRIPITQPFHTGVRAIDGLLACGRGQRIGIFAGSGTGKSTLLGMIGRSSSADVNVLCLIGERGREVRDFIEHILGPEGLRRSVVIVATSDTSALLRVRASLLAATLAEYFARSGRHVLLLMDSVTRLAMAQREIGIASGEPPTRGGYTASVFSLLPKLLERAGNLGRGDITAFYTVLVDGDNLDEPVADACRSLLDGHIVLARDLTKAGHFPPIDILASASRLMSQVADPEHQALALRFRRLLAAHQKVGDLVRVGAYRGGSDPEADEALARFGAMSEFLRQRHDEASPWVRSLERLAAVLQPLPQAAPPAPAPPSPAATAYLRKGVRS
jgi:flagellum-specific ATP synthase